MAYKCLSAFEKFESMRRTMETSQNLSYLSEIIVVYEFNVK